MGFLERLLPPAGRDRFAKLMMRAIRAAGNAEKFEYDAQSFSIKVTGGKGGSFFLANAYRDYCTVPLLQRSLVRRRYATTFGREMPEAPTAFADAKARLLPQVRDRAYFEGVRQHLEMQGEELRKIPTQVLAEDLAVALVVDFPETVMTVNEELLAQWQVPFDEALASARDNLWKISNEDFVQPRPGFYISVWQDAHAASRLLLHDLIWQLPVKGEHVAMIPNRDLLLVTGSEDEEGLLAMAGMAEKALDHTRSLTGRAFVLRNSQWVHFCPPEGARAHKPFRMLLVKSVQEEYASQKPYVEYRHRQSGEDVFAASVMILENAKTEVIVTRCVWAQGVDSLLPRTDEIALVMTGSDGQPGQVITCTWQTVQDVVGGLMVPVEAYPARCRVKSFPSKDQIRVLIERSGPDAVQALPSKK
jgi:hypothetical protein